MFPVRGERVPSEGAWNLKPQGLVLLFYNLSVGNWQMELPLVSVSSPYWTTFSVVLIGPHFLMHGLWVLSHYKSWGLKTETIWSTSLNYLIWLLRKSYWLLNSSIIFIGKGYIINTSTIIIFWAVDTATNIYDVCVISPHPKNNWEAGIIIPIYRKAEIWRV